MHTAKELHDWLEASNLFEPDARQIILRALSLLASVESSGDDVVCNLRSDARVSRRMGQCDQAETMEEAAARITLDAQERAALKAELASVKANAESSGDEVVRELREAIDYIAVYGQFSVAPDVMKRAAALILAQRQEIERVKANAESSGDEVVRELHALRESAKPFPSGAGGQQCGMESYRIVASGNQLEVIYTAAARIAALEYHAEAMAAYLSGYLRSVTSDKLVSAYREEFPLRAAHPKDAP